MYLKAQLHKTHHAGRKSQRRHYSQSEAAIVTTNASDWLSHLRCDLWFVCCVLCSWTFRYRRCVGKTLLTL